MLSGEIESVTPLQIADWEGHDDTVAVMARLIYAQTVPNLLSLKFARYGLPQREQARLVKGAPIIQPFYNP